MNYKLITVLSLSLLIACQTKSKPVAKTQQIAETDTVQTDTTPLFNVDTAGYLLQLPMGNPDMLKRWKDVDKTVDLYDSYNINQTFCDSFLCGKSIKYNPNVFKEPYDELYPIYVFTRNPEVIISKKHIQKSNCSLYFAYTGSRDQVKIFILTVKNNRIIDSKTVYYNVESTFPFGRLFYIDQNLKLSFRDYSFTDEGILQSPVSQWTVNADGKFVQCYKNDGLYQTKEEQGLIKNHLREGKWIEKKSNMMLYVNFSELFGDNRCTYLEATYHQGVPTGEWRFYRLDFEYGADPLSGKKGELVYTEIYENGKLKERIFEKEILDANKKINSFIY